MKNRMSIIGAAAAVLAALAAGCGSSPGVIADSNDNSSVQSPVAYEEKAAPLIAPPSAPAWYTNTELVYPDREYIGVIGDGKTPEAARKQAVIEMSRRFHITVESVSEDISKYRETVGSGKNGFSEELFLNQYSRIESNEDFFGIRFTDAWLNPQGNTYTVLAYINRKEAEEQYHSRIEANMIGINALLSAAAQHDDPHYSSRLLSRGKSIVDMTKRFIDNMPIIYPGKSKEYLETYTPHLNTIQQFSSEQERLRSIRISAAVEFRGNTPVSETDKSILRQGIQEAIGRYNVPVQMYLDPSAASGEKIRYAFVITLNSAPTPSGILDANVALSFTRNGEALPLPPANSNFKEQDTAWVIKKAVAYIRDNRPFYQAIAAEIN